MKCSAGLDSPRTENPEPGDTKPNGGSSEGAAKAKVEEWKGEQGLELGPELVWNDDGLVTEWTLPGKSDISPEMGDQRSEARVGSQQATARTVYEG